MVVSTIFGLTGFIIILGFLGNYLFKKTGIPDIIILIFLGLLIGPILHKIDPSVFFGVSELFASLALMILLFNSGLNLNLYRVIQESPRAVLLVINGVVITMALTVVFTKLAWGWNLLNGLLLGAIVCGSSSFVIVPPITKIKVKEKLVTLLSLESAFTDAVTVVIGITLLQLLTTPTIGDRIYSVSHGIASAFSIGVVLGFITGAVWLRILKKTKDEPYSNILTLSIVFLLFSAVESLGGNGAISTLIFGLVLGNGVEISKMFKMKEPMEASKVMREFHSEISFLVRTFFFVYLGLIAAVKSLVLILFGVILSIFILVGRYMAVKVSSIGDDILENNKDVITIMLPRGLAAAVLSQLTIAYGIAHAKMYSDIVFTVIVSTVLICTIGVFVVSRRLKREDTQ